MSDPISDADLRRLAEAATPGKWELAREKSGVYAGRHSVVMGKYARVASTSSDEHTVTGEFQQNAAFIAAANPQRVIALLDRVRELEAHIAERNALLDGNEAEILAKCARAIEPDLSFGLKHDTLDARHIANTVLTVASLIIHE